MSGITPEVLASLEANFKAEPRYGMAQNAITRADFKEVIADRSASVQAMDTSFSCKVNEMKVTNQRASGRCWLFAACNTMRVGLRKKYNLPDSFQLSPNYLYFYDKLERSNYFFDAVEKTLELETDSRVVQHLLSDVLNDGGQWDMAVNLIVKYGIVPMSAYPEAFSSKNSRNMNAFLRAKLRDWACDVRHKHSNGHLSDAALAQAKKEGLDMIHRILCIFLGTPPKTFSWNFEDKDKKFQSFPDITPVQFYQEHIPFKAETYMSLINDPRNEYDALYTVKFLGNVLDGIRPAVKYLNVDINVIRKFCKAQLDAGHPVWFGVDVGKDFHRTLAVMDTKIFDYDTAFGTKPSMGKADRLRYGQSLMTHAMVFTGYHEVDGNITKWRVENSWGKQKGVDEDDGYYTMSDEWFSEYLYQIIVPQSELSDFNLEMEVTELPPWDPMGALA
jgi:bleomycin hydrolase